jgi:MFS family permease
MSEVPGLRIRWRSRGRGFLGPAARRDFTLLWAGQAASQLGSRIYGVAYMLWVLAVTGSPAQAGVVASVTLAAFTAAQLPAGWLTDRFDRRSIMIACDAASAAAALSLCAAAAAGWFQLPMLLGTAIVLGCGWAVRGTAETAALPHVVSPGELTSANAMMTGRVYAVGIAGPPLAGVLFAVSPTLPFLVDGLSYLVALGCVAFVWRPLQSARTAAPGPPKRTSPVADIRAGLHVFWREPFIRTTAVLDAATEFAVNALGLTLIIMLRESGASPSSIGVVLGVGSAAGLAGAAVAAFAGRRLSSPRGVLVAAPAVGAAAILWLAAGSGTLHAAAAYAAFFLLQPAWTAVITTQLLTRVEDEWRGRVYGAVGLVTAVPVVATPAATGLLLSAFGTRTTCFVLAAALAGVALAAAASRAIRNTPACLAPEVC